MHAGHPVVPDLHSHLLLTHSYVCPDGHAGVVGLGSLQVVPPALLHGHVCPDFAVDFSLSFTKGEYESIHLVPSQ